MEELRIKATSIVVLWDEETHTIVNFDVEPGFEHQWGYGRQRFLKQSTLSENSNTVKAQAIIKEWTEQHEYELGKYAIELLKQSKSSRADTIRHVNFIVDQANQESEWSTEKAALERQKSELENQLKILEQNKSELLAKRQSLEEEIARLKIELANKTDEVETQKAEVQRLTQELEDAQTQIVDNSTQKLTGGDSGDNGDTGSNQVQRDPNLGIIADLKDQLETKNTEIEDLKKQIADLTEKLAEADKLKEEIEKLKEENKTLSEDVQNKQAQIDDMNKKSADALQTVTALNADKDILQKKIDELADNVAKLSQLVKDQAKENAHLKDELAKAKQESEDALAAADKEKADLQNTVDEKIKELDEEKAKNGELATQITVLQENLQSAEADSIVEYKKRVQIVAKRHNGARDQLIKAKADIDMARENARKAIELLKPIAGLEEVVIPEAIPTEEIDITVEEEAKITNNIKIEVNKPSEEPNPVVTPEPVDPPAPEPEPAVIEPVIIADKDPEPDPVDPQEDSRDETPAVPEPEPAPVDVTPVVEDNTKEENDTVPENVVPVEEVGEDMIIAEKEPEPEKPVFFPPKKSDSSEAPKSPKEPDTISVNSTASRKSSTSKARKGSKALAKFDLKMGLKDKKDKKESGFSKFLKMCTGKGSDKDKSTIEDQNKDPQLNPPASQSS